MNGQLFYTQFTPCLRSLATTLRQSCDHFDYKEVTDAEPINNFVTNNIFNFPNQSMTSQWPIVCTLFPPPCCCCCFGRKQNADIWLSKVVIKWLHVVGSQPVCVRLMTISTHWRQVVYDAGWLRFDTLATFSLITGWMFQEYIGGYW